ncbi:SAVED domain-containing protein [Priestia megaterium]|uniref:SAVED domain-containing protein n=1 Tax=Priestia megaterium TaxID=1404 RepID=UPI003CFC1D5A
MRTLLYVLLIMIIVGAFLFFKNMANQNKEQGYAIVLFTTGIGLITSAFGTIFDNVIKTFMMLQSTSVKDSLKIQESFDVNYPSLIIGGILVLTGIWFQRYINNKMFILNINGYYDRRIDGHHKELGLSTFEFKEREIDFIGLFKSKKMNKALASIIAVLIKEKVKSFKEESRHFQRGYTGIAPIPFVALAGTYLKREKIDKFYEYDKVETNAYFSLKTEKAKLFFKGNENYPDLRLQTDISSLNAEKEEAVIAISITQEILDAHLEQFSEAEIVKFSLDAPCDNAIQFEAQLIYYRKQIIDTIYALNRQMQNLALIHIVYSGQSCLALEIGKNIEDFRMPSVVIYQFDSQEQKKYPWGIKLNGDNTGSFVQG